MIHLIFFVYTLINERLSILRPAPIWIHGVSTIQHILLFPVHFIERRVRANIIGRLIKTRHGSHIVWRVVSRSVNEKLHLWFSFCLRIRHCYRRRKSALRLRNTWANLVYRVSLCIVRLLQIKNRASYSLTSLPI